MPTGGDSKGPSLLILEEYFASQDAKFLEMLRSARDPKVLGAFGERWKRDRRPWARAQLRAYLDQALDRPGHQVLVKHLFKDAEEKGDTELMADFAIAFDRLVKRRKVTRHRYDWRVRVGWTEDRLIALSDGRPAIPIWGSKPPKWNNDATANQPPGPLFSNPTRNYLRRRAWRFFRRLAFRNPSAYVPAIAVALAAYTDDDLSDGLAILDSWSLVHVCFFESPAIAFTPDHANPAEGHSLAELAAAPFKPELWQSESATPVLMNLLAGARSRLVRNWSIQLIRAHHRDRLDQTPIEVLMKLLDHEDEEVEQFGAELLSTARGMEKLPVESWLAMLSTRNLTALQGVADATRRHVTAERLTLQQTIDLAKMRAAPAARIGLEFLRVRQWRSVDDRKALAALSSAASPSMGREMAVFALSMIDAEGVYEADLAARFFDSLSKEIRLGAWDWLVPASRGYDDSALWTRLLETPYDDVRLRLIETLEQLTALPGLSSNQLRPTWMSVLLGVYRGGRQKLKSMSQIREALSRDPAGAIELIPVLAIAIRSVRPAEGRPALAALVRAVEVHPPLAESVRRFLPELDLAPEGVC